MLLTPPDSQANRLLRVGDGIRHLSLLEELYLGHNGLTSIDGLGHGFPCLTTLDLTGNAIVSLDGVQACTALTDLWVSRERLFALLIFFSESGVRDSNRLYCKNHLSQMGYNKVASFACVEVLRALPVLSVL